MPRRQTIELPDDVVDEIRAEVTRWRKEYERRPFDLFPVADSLVLAERERDTADWEDAMETMLERFEWHEHYVDQSHLTFHLAIAECADEILEGYFYEDPVNDPEEDLRHLYSDAEQTAISDLAYDTVLLLAGEYLDD